MSKEKRQYYLPDGREYMNQAQVPEKDRFLEEVVMNIRKKRNRLGAILGSIMIILAGNATAFAEGHGGGFRGSGLHMGGFHERGFNNRGWDGADRHGHFRAGFFIGPDWFVGPTMVIGGVSYYYYDGSYYTPSGDNMVVVTPPPATPDVTVTPAPAPKTQAAIKEQPQTEPKVIARPGDTVVNVPNSDGGFTSVILTKHDKGYLGPNGEYYADHPTSAQLKALYSR